MTDRLVTAKPLTDDRADEGALRPTAFAEYIGQERIKDNLRVFVTTARERGDALDHVLLCGPPGLGKTTLAHIIAREMGVTLRVTSGPALEKKGDLVGILTSLNRGDVLFIDEIHRLNAAVEESLYPAMEDSFIDIVLGAGPHAATRKVLLERFTLVGATTRTGLISSPLRDRFGIVARMEYYSTSELVEVVGRSARLLGIAIDDAGCDELARRSRGTPRIANRLLRRIRDFAQHSGAPVITREVADESLRRLDVDAAGLDAMDRAILAAICEKFGGGPVGAESLAAAVSEERDTIEDVYEPYLIQQGFLARTPRGRIAMPVAYRHLGLEEPRGRQTTLL